MITRLYEELFEEREISYETFKYRVYDCIKKLKREHAWAMTEVYINGISYQNVAREFNISLESLKIRLREGKKELRFLLLDEDGLSLESPVLKLTKRCSNRTSTLTIGEVINAINEGTMKPSKETDLIIDLLLENGFEVEVTELYRFIKPYPVNLFHRMYKDIGYDVKGDKRFEILKFILNGSIKNHILTPTQCMLLEQRYKDDISLRKCATMLHKSTDWTKKTLNEIESKLRNEIERRKYRYENNDETT